jgi:hypothetical protein
MHVQLVCSDLKQITKNQQKKFMKYVYKQKRLENIKLK